MIPAHSYRVEDYTALNLTYEFHSRRKIEFKMLIDRFQLTFLRYIFRSSWFEHLSYFSFLFFFRN